MRDALVVQRQAPLSKRLACFVVDDPDVILLGRETIFRDGRQAGWLTSAGWGYTIGAYIGYGYVRDQNGVDDAMLDGGQYALEVAGVRVPCMLARRALVDPENLRIKG